MRNPLADKVVDIKPSGIRKFFDIVSEMQDAISLGVGEPDFDTPWHIRDEGIYSLEKGRTFYTSNAGLKDLRQEICNTIRRKQGVTYDWQHEVLVTVGGSEAIDIGLRAMCNPGDEVLIPQPSYVSYEPCAVLAGATPVIIDLKAENEFRLTAEELEAAITDKTKVLILPFPNNPTGAIMEKSDLEAIAKVIEEHDIFVMSDEIYSELTYKEKHVSIVSLPGMKERTIYINGFSKAYAMTGWRLGYCCGPAAIIQQMTKIHQFAIMCAPTTSQYAAACQPFTFGEFSLYEGKNSFNLMWAGVENYFDTLKKDLDLIYYASYFCELASYLTRENNDELEILKLLYQTLRALEKKTIDIELVRCIYEIKILALYGIGIEASRCVKCGSREDLIWFDARESGVVCNKCEHGKVKVSPATLYTLQYILYSSIERLYTFKVSADVLWELKKIIREYMRYHVNHEFKSLSFL